MYHDTAKNKNKKHLYGTFGVYTLEFISSFLFLSLLFTKKNKIHIGCEMEDCVERHLCKLVCDTSIAPTAASDRIVHL